MILLDPMGYFGAKKVSELGYFSQPPPSNRLFFAQKWTLKKWEIAKMTGGCNFLHKITPEGANDGKNMKSGHILDEK